ncbi:O102 family O-antigen flippase, partial [Escherichia coli]|nr:O102 family O-antigen flippase [Escherichia coli]MDF7063218.1 O102 family O-antigen flippase [Escherichia coli]
MSLLKNSIWNFGGYIIPTIVALPALGYIARELGAERFGLFALCTAIVGYASIFDAGLTRAVIREIAFNRTNKSELNKIIATSNFAIIILGLVGAALLFMNIDNLVSLLKVSPRYKDDVVSSFKILTITIPLFLLNQIFVSYLEGMEDFFNINIQRCISSSLVAGLPAFFIILHPTLTCAMIGLVCGRMVSLIISYYCAKEIVLTAGIRFHKQVLFRLLKFGGWITVSNIISPVMSYFDRFILSNLLGAKSVGFYIAPSEFINRLINIPWALARALFPKLSAAKTLSERKKNETIAYIMLSMVCIPAVIIGVGLSYTILNIWLGKEYAENSTYILQVLLIGFLFNSYAQIPFATIQAAGKAKITALIHCIEIIPYLVGLYFFIIHFGVIGAAYAWTIRVSLD